MKLNLNKNYLLRTVAGSPVVVAVGEEAAKLGGMITLNETGEFIWKKIEELGDYDAVLAALEAEYPQVDAARLHDDLDRYISKLKDRKILDEA